MSPPQLSEELDKGVGASTSRRGIGVTKQLPYSLEAEACLLGCCLMDGADSIARCLEAKLPPEAFYSPRNRIVYERICALYEKNPPVDVAVLAEELKTSRQLVAVGGYAYLVELTNRIPTTAQVPYFIAKVRELHLLREIIRVGSTAVEKCFDFSGGISEFVDQIETSIFAVTQARVVESARGIKESADQAMGIITKMIQKKGELTGVPSGFKDLDTLTWGFQPQEMIVLAARPSMGKTSLALNIVDHAALPPRGDAVAVLMFSLEMSSAQLALRMICSRARQNMTLLREGLLPKHGEEMQRLAAAAEEIAAAPIAIDDSSHLTVMEMRAKARRCHTRRKLGLIVVDYLQLMSPADSSLPREQQVAEASRGLKALAKELDVPVIVLSQLNRTSERESRTPRLSDLRESGAIEQDADVVLLLARPQENGDDHQAAANVADLIVAKQRNGPVGDCKLTFFRPITRFENYTP